MQSFHAARNSKVCLVVHACFSDVFIDMEYLLPTCADHAWEYFIWVGSTCLAVEWCAKCMQWHDENGTALRHTPAPSMQFHLASPSPTPLRSSGEATPH